MTASRRDVILFSALALALWVYLILRAVYVPLVHDEIATFFHYIHRKEFLPFRSHWDANNHFLNTALSTFFYSVFGPTPWALRMGSLLSFPVYAFFTWKLSRLLRQPLTRYALWAALLFAHSLVEFMALTRGYGMSMAFLLGAVYYTARYMQTMRFGALAGAFAMTALALAANLTLTNTTLLLTALLLGVTLLGKPRSKLVILVFILAAFGSLLAGASRVAFEMKKLGLLYYGSPEGFWPVTVKSLAKLLAARPSALVAYAGAALFAWTLGAGLWFALRTRLGEWRKQPAILLLLLLAGNLAGTVALHYLLGVNYPEDRTGMYFYYFLVLAAVFVADALALSWRSLAPVMMVPLLLLPVHFASRVNLTHTAYWSYEHYDETVYNAVRQNETGNEAETGIGGYAIQRLVWAWYNYRHGGALNLMQTHDFPAYDYDYLLITSDMKAPAEGRYTQLHYDKISDLCLLQRQTSMSKKLLLETENHNGENTRQEYFNFFETHSDSLGGRSLFADVEMAISSDKRPFIASVVFSATLADDSRREEVVQLDWLKDAWKPGDVFHHGIYLYRLPPGLKRVVIYIWNIRQAEYRMEWFRLKLYEVQTEG